MIFCHASERAEKGAIMSQSEGWKITSTYKDWVSKRAEWASERTYFSLQNYRTLTQKFGGSKPLKTLAKNNVVEYWEKVLRLESQQLTSLIFFQTSRLSLRQPSVLWLMAGSNAFENSKSLIVSKMTSGRYRSDYLARHWTPSNKHGFCIESTCIGVVGDLVHMLIICPSIKTHQRQTP